jgi:hypothetical protein
VQVHASCARACAGFDVARVADRDDAPVMHCERFGKRRTTHRREDFASAQNQVVVGADRECGAGINAQQYGEQSAVHGSSQLLKRVPVCARTL